VVFVLRFSELLGENVSEFKVVSSADAFCGKLIKPQIVKIFSIEHVPIVFTIAESNFRPLTEIKVVFTPNFHKLVLNIIRLLFVLFELTFGFVSFLNAIFNVLQVFVVRHSVRQHNGTKFEELFEFLLMIQLANDH
jgi:hypothetical protein